MEESKKLASIEIPEFNTEDDLQLEVGVTYKGSFRLSRNGMITVKPYQEGSRPTNLKKVIEGDRHVIYRSKNVTRVVISIQNADADTMRQAYREIIVDCYKDFNDTLL